MDEAQCWPGLGCTRVWVMVVGRLSYPLPLNLVSVSWKIMIKKKISFKNTSTDHLIQRFRFWVYTWRK